MKVLQVTNFFKPSWETGGPARSAYQISKQLVERGHDVTVYTTDGYKPRLNVKKNRPLNVDDITTYYFKNLSTFVLYTFTFPIPYFAPIIAKNNVKNFDVIHIHEYRTFLAIIIHYYAKKHNVPYVLQARGSVLPFFQKQRMKAIFDLFFKKILLDASYLLALNNREVEEYIMMGAKKEKICLLPNGIDLSDYKQLPQKRCFREKNSIKDEEKMILFLGRLNKIKGVDLLIESFFNLSMKLENIKLVIAGPDGGIAHDLQEQAKSLNIIDKIIFTGPLYGTDKLEAYVDADIYVLPSISECFPNTVLEACSCKIPVIITTGCGIKDIVDNKIGFVVEYNSKMLCDAMFKLLSDESLRIKFGLEGYKLVNERFTWDKVVGDLEILYENVSNSKF